MWLSPVGGGVQSAREGICHTIVVRLYWRARPARLELELDEDLSKTFVVAEDGRGGQVLSVHAKRSYRFSALGECRLSDVQAPLLDLGEQDDYAEPDIIPRKLGTDLIVIASAYAPGGR